MGCSIGVVKYLVFIFNFIFVLCGLGIIIYGVVLKVQYKDDVILAPIVFGVVVFIIAFFGCCGAIKESRCMLITFAVILIILFVISLIFGVVAILILANNSEGYKDCTNQLQSLHYNYERGRDQETWEEKQRTYQCCGVHGPEDFKSFSLPQSCCEGEKIECTKDDPELIKTGCIAVCDLFYWVLQVMGIVIIVVALVELTGSICAICLANAIQSQWRRGAYA